MILLIDNYDSFTHNLVHLIGEMGHEVTVKRNDAISPSEAIGTGSAAIVISPGPKTPSEAGICLDLIGLAAVNKVPLFGVCLGMQAIAQHFGGVVRRADNLMHGKTCGVRHDGVGVFKELPSPFTATRYHSLVVEAESLPSTMTITATASDDNEVMAVAHKTLPIAGVQFHPESIASDHGGDIISNFFREAGV